MAYFNGNNDFIVVLGGVGGSGKDGVWIKSIEKTSTDGLVDTYTITLTDGQTSTFTVTNGKDGGGGGGTSEDVEKRLAGLEQQMADMNYKKIAITSFSASNSTFEMGETVDSVTLNWSTNKTPTALTFDGAPINVSEKSKTVVGSFNMDSEKKSWTLKATDERDGTDTKTASITFLNGVYYGAKEEPEKYDSAFILSLTKTLRSSYLSSFSANAGSGQYIYYCLPVRMGTRAFKVGGFDGGFSLVATFDFKNSKGYTESYYIYRSDNAALGSTSVTVS